MSATENVDLADEPGMTNAPTPPPRPKLLTKSHFESGTQIDVTSKIFQHSAKDVSGQGFSIKSYKRYLFQKWHLLKKSL